MKLRYAVVFEQTARAARTGRFLNVQARALEQHSVERRDARLHRLLREQLDRDATTPDLSVPIGRAQSVKAATEQARARGRVAGRVSPASEW